VTTGYLSGLTRRDTTEWSAGNTFETTNVTTDDVSCRSKLGVLTLTTNSVMFIILLVTQLSEDIGRHHTPVIPLRVLVRQLITKQIKDITYPIQKMNR